MMEKQETQDVSSDTKNEKENPKEVTPKVSNNHMNELQVFYEKVKQFIKENELEFETSTEDETLKSVNELWDIVTTENTKMKREFETATKALENDPRLAVLFNELMRETPIRVALVRSGIYDFTPQCEDVDYNEYQEALKTHKQRREEFKNRRIAHEINCKHTAETIDKFYEERKATDKEIEQFSEYVVGMFDSFVDGIIDCSLLEFLWKGFVFDKKIDEAKEIGKIEGKNEVIEQRTLSLKDDGISSKNNLSNETKPQKVGYIERILNGTYQ